MTRKKDIEKKFVNDDGIGKYSGYFLVMLMISIPYVFLIILALSFFLGSSVVLSGASLWIDRLESSAYVIFLTAYVLLWMRRRSGIILMLTSIVLKILHTILYDLHNDQGVSIHDDWSFIFKYIIFGVLWYFAWKSQQKYMSKYSID